MIDFRIEPAGDAALRIELPARVDEAISAREKKNSIVNEAKAYASKIVPEARGTAARIKAEAEGYRQASIAKATGDSARFRLLADQYRKAPEVTRKRLYLETMQEVTSRNPKVLAGGKNNILYLPLGGQVPAADNPAVRPPAQTLVRRHGGNAEPDRAGGGVCPSEQPASTGKAVPQRKQYITRWQYHRGDVYRQLRQFVG